MSPRNSYSDAFKAAAVERVVIDGETRGSAIDDLGITPSSLCRWIASLSSEVIERARSDEAASPEAEVDEYGLLDQGEDEPDEEVDDDSTVLDLLLSKLPDFDPKWPDLDRVNWFNAFNHLAELAVTGSAKQCSTFYPRTKGLAEGINRNEEEAAPRSDPAGATARGDGSAGHLRPVVLGLVGAVQQLATVLAGPARFSFAPVEASSSALDDLQREAERIHNRLVELRRRAQPGGGDGAGDHRARAVAAAAGGQAATSIESADEGDQGGEEAAVGRVGGSSDGGRPRVPGGDRTASVDENGLRRDDRGGAELAELGGQR